MLLAATNICAVEFALRNGIPQDEFVSIYCPEQLRGIDGRGKTLHVLEGAEYNMYYHEIMAEALIRRLTITKE